MLHWPAQAEEAEALGAIGRTRLPLVAPDADSLISEDSLCEWVRLPAAERDLAARILTLTRRLEPAATKRPRVDASGRLLFRNTGVALPPTEARWASALAENFKAVVPEAGLGSRGWPPGAWSGNTLRVHLTRLRHRLAPLFLEVRAVRSQGFVLQMRPFPTVS